MNKYLLLAALAICLGAFNSVSTQAQTANGNTIYACYQKNNGQLRRVNSPGECKPSEIALSWNVAGIPGPKGDKGEAGQSVTSEVIPSGDARCQNGVGGVQYTDSSGIRVVCNGQQGVEGEKGEQGERGISFGDTVNESKVSINQCLENVVATIPITLTEASRIYVSATGVFVPLDSGATGAQVVAVLKSQNGQQVLAQTFLMAGQASSSQSALLISNGVLQSNGTAFVAAPGTYQLQMQVTPLNVCSPGQAGFANGASMSIASLSYILLGTQP